MRSTGTALAQGVVALLIAGCANNASLPEASQYGSTPPLPPPHQEFVPTTNTPTVKGWKTGETPMAAAGLKVEAFATDLKHPRWLYVLPNGDVLVAESNHGAQMADTMGYGGWLESLVRRFNGLFIESANQITLLRNTRSNGTADV